MRFPRLTIGTLIVIVMILAADFATLRFVFTVLPYDKDRYASLLLGILPVTNLLAFGCFRVFSDIKCRSPYSFGFLMSCLLISTVWTITWLVLPESMVGRFDVWFVKFCTNLSWELRSHIRSIYYSRLVYSVIAVAAFICLTFPPQLIIALLGGLLSERIARRRSHQVGDSVSMMGGAR